MPWIRRAFHEFLQHEARRQSAAAVIAGDLFDLSVMIPGTRAHPARTHGERTSGLARRSHRRRAPATDLREPPTASARPCGFAAAGFSIDIIVGNHDIELMEPEVAAEFEAPVAHAPGDGVERIRIVPWFVYEPGQVWIEHGHNYDEACSFEYSLSPCDPQDGQLMFNADYAATRYLAMTCPRSIRTGSRSGASGATCATASMSACARSGRCGSRTRGSRGRWFARVACMTRSSGAIDAGARIASGCIAWLKTPALPSTR